MNIKWPTAQDCGFLKRTSIIPGFYLAGCIRGSEINNIQTCWHNDNRYLIGVTRLGWFALFPINSNTETPASIVILRKDHVDYFFDIPEQLNSFLNAPLKYKTIYCPKLNKEIVVSGEFDISAS